MLTRRNGPHSGAVEARLCTRSTRARAAISGSSACSPSTHCTRLLAFTGTVTAGSVSPQGPSPAAAVSWLTNAVKRVPCGACARQLWDQLAGVDLHAAGLAGHEEDEVQADVHRPGG